MINRKLVRPNLSELKDKMNNPRGLPQHQHGQGEGGAQDSRGHQGHDQPRTRDYRPTRRRPTPPEVTSAEAFYYLKQMNSKTPMIVVLDTGEQIRGHIEWYDRQCIKVHREDGPNILLFKHAVRFMYKEEDEPMAADAGQDH